MPKAVLYSGFFASQQHAVNYAAYIDKQSPLFNTSGDISLAAALGQLEACEKSIKWRHVFSMRGEDVQRLAVDRDYMQKIVATKKDEWAKAHNISPENLVVLASFHEVDAHPHLHMLMFSTNTREGYILRNADKTNGEIFKRARETTKSSIANEVFKNDLHEVKVTKAEQRTQMREELTILLHSIGKSTRPVPIGLEEKMRILSAALARQVGKHQYGYLAPPLKAQVDEILHTAVEADKDVNVFFKRYTESQKALVETYVDSDITMGEKMLQWQQSFFSPTKNDNTALHNVIIRAADEMPGVERYKEEKACEAFDEGAALKQDTAAPNRRAPMGRTAGFEKTHIESASNTQTVPDVPKSEALLAAEYNLKAAAERYLRGTISKAFAAQLTHMSVEPLSYAKQSTDTKAQLHALVSQMVQAEVPELNELLIPIHTQMAPNLPFAQFSQQYLNGQQPADAQYTQTATTVGGADTPTPLHHLVLEYAPHFHGEQTADLRAIQKEKDVRALRMQLMRALDRGICSALNDNGNTSDEQWGALAARLHSTQPITLQDGTVLPKGYRTASKDDQKQIEQFVRSCWRQECSQVAERLAKMENKSEAEYEAAMCAPAKGEAATAPNLAVRHLLQYAARSSGASQQPFYAENTQRPVRDKCITPEQEEPEPTEAEQLAAWRVRHAVEKHIMNKPEACANHLLQLHEAINFQHGAVPYYALTQAQQARVDAFASLLLHQSSVQAQLRACYQAQKEHFAGVQQYEAALFQGDRANALRSLVLEYAAAATPQTPVALNMPQRRESRKEIERALDRVVCAALNGDVQGELYRTLVDTGGAVLPRAQQESAQSPEELIFYGQLEPDQKMFLNEQLEVLLQKPSVQQAVQAMMWQCGEKGTVQQWIQTTIRPLKNNGARLQNLLLHHLEVHRWEQENGKPRHERMTQDAKHYQDKTPLMALTGMLYALSATMHEDTRRVQNHMSSQHGHKKIRVKKIEKLQKLKHEPMQP